MLPLILFILLIIAVVVMIEFRERRKNKASDDSSPTSTPVGQGECCGSHLVCERDYLDAPADEIIYFDDEELDEFSGIKSDSYSESQIKIFEDILFTLKEYDVEGWLHSLQQRNIELPEPLRDEAFLIVSENRKNRRTQK